MITTDANELIAPISDKMPAILKASDESKWLELHHTMEDLLELIQPFPADQMGMYTVSPMIDSNKVDQPSMIKAGPTSGSTW